MERVTVLVSEGAPLTSFQPILGAVIEACGGSATDCMAYDRGSGWLMAVHPRLQVQVTVQYEGSRPPAGVTAVFLGGEG